MLLLSLFLACPTDTPKPTDTGDTVEAGPDTDGDGVPDSTDCAPDNNNIYPGNFEIPYNGVDDNCDGIDVMDVDGDGYNGTGGGGDDCDDSNPEIHAGHVESCYDGLDNNCDGLEALEGADPNDCDGDGYDRSHDCWDDVEDLDFVNGGGLTPELVYPDADDAWYDGTDADCEGNDDFDQDADGEQSLDYAGTDCVDTDARVNTAMDELWNDFDDNCDGALDAMTPSNVTMKVGGASGDGEDAFGATVVWLPDLDGDGRDDLAVGVPYTNEYVGRLYIIPTEDGIVTPELEALAMIDGKGGTGWALARTSVTGAETLAVGSPWGESSGAVDFYELDNIGSGAEIARIEHDVAGGSVIDLGDGSLLIGCTYGSTNLAISTWSAVSGTLDLRDADFDVTSDDYACTDSASLGDLTGDGAAELVLGGSDADGNWRLFYADSALRAGGGGLSPSDLGDYGGYTAGTLFSTLPDITGDGYDEAMISLPTADALSTGDGRTWIINGDDWSPAWSSSAFATVSGGVSGAIIRPGSLGDPDNDGAEDLLIGAPGQGSVYWVSLSALAAGGDVVPAASTPSFHDTTGGDLYGTNAWSHDLDADGDDDLLVLLGLSPGQLQLYTHDE